MEFITFDLIISNYSKSLLWNQPKIKYSYKLN